MRLPHVCKINIWGKPKFYPLYRQSRAPCSIALTLTLLHITLLEKYMRTTKAGCLNGLRNRVKDLFDSIQAKQLESWSLYSSLYLSLPSPAIHSLKRSLIPKGIVSQLLYDADTSKSQGEGKSLLNNHAQNQW